jgi:hypothetical protein
VTESSDPTLDVPIEAETADVVEQRTEVGSTGGIDETALTDDPEVPEADKLEQAQEVVGADDEEER